jgi:hypothetical protein
VRVEAEEGLPRTLNGNAAWKKYVEQELCALKLPPLRYLAL